MENEMKRREATTERTEAERIAELESGELTSGDARALIAEILAEDRGDRTAIRLYEALRAWLGVSLRDRNASGNLREWYPIVEAVAAQFDDLMPVWAARFEVLSDLLRDRIALDEARPATEILRRRHVPELLNLLARSAGFAMARVDIMNELGLGQANLSRVLRLARDAGLLDRETSGKEAEFALSGLGLSLLAKTSDAEMLIPDYVLFDAEPWEEASLDMATKSDEPSIGEYVATIEEAEPLPMAA